MQIQQSFNEATNLQVGALYLVPTPIGNLEDMTFRAVRTLQESDIILAEDTRNSGKLLKHFNIPTSMQAFHEHTRQNHLEAIVQSIASGKKVSLISDAGMPLINDPGYPLVEALLAKDMPVIALPGANAAITALVASGLAGDRFTYYGFFPRKASEQKLVVEQVGHRQETAIFYESPHRILKTVRKLHDFLPSDTQVVIAREITKKFESYLRGTVESVYQSLQEQTIKGEIVIIVEGGSLIPEKQTLVTDQNIVEAVQTYIDEGALTPTQAIKQVAKQCHLKRNDVYNIYHQLGKS